MRNNKLYPNTLILALALSAPATLALAESVQDEAKAPKPKLTSHEVPVIGLAIFPDTNSYTVFGKKTLLDMAAEHVDVLNVTALSSDGRAHFVLTTVTKTKISASTPAGFIAKAENNKTILSKIASSGADLAQIWGNIFTGGAADCPTSKKAFGPGMRWSFAPTGGDVLNKAHETSHNLGAQHNEGASDPPKSSQWPDAVGQIYPDGTCELMSYCVLQKTTLSEGNAAMFRRAAPWVTPYNPVLPASKNKACIEEVGVACLADRIRTEVLWVDPQTFEYNLSTKVSSTGTIAEFAVGAKIKAVAKQVRVDGEDIEVVDLGLTLGVSTAPYRIILTDSVTGHVRAWDVQAGEKFNLSVPAAF